MMRLEIRYLTTFEYPQQVRDSHNVLRACPTTDDFQALLSYTLTTDPAARVLSHIDYWGTRLDVFGIRHPHDRLSVIADSTVETYPRPAPEPDASTDPYRDDAYRTEHREYLADSPHTIAGSSLGDRARQLVGDRAQAVAAVEALIDEVRRLLAYEPGTTYVGMNLDEVVKQGSGVCQDFAHTLISMARSAGIPARYVSGYLYAADQSLGRPPEEAEIEVQTHAWAEVAIPGWGWWAVDPTNREPVGEHHVKIGHGRDYDDVAPLQGVYHGPANHRLGVSVRISREQMSEYQSQQ